MTGTELAELAKAAGVPGMIVGMMLWLASRRDWTRKDDHGRYDELIAQIEKMDGKIDRLGEGNAAIRDRTTLLEAEVRGMSRRLDRMDR